MSIRKINRFCLVISTALAVQMFFPSISFSSGLIYTIQAGSFRDIADARECFHLIAKGLDEKNSVSVRIEKIGKYFSVRVGKFEDYLTAEIFLRANASGLPGAVILKAYFRDERIIDVFKGSSGRAVNEVSPEDRERAETVYNLGLGYGGSGRHREAVKAFRRVLRITPDSADAYYNLGVAYDNLAMYKEAIEAYREAVRINPYSEKAYCNLGIAYVETGLYEEAIDAYGNAVRLNPDSPDLYVNLGIAHGRAGMYKQAADILRVAVKMDPDYADAHYNLGFAYLMSGDKNSAIREFEILQGINTEFAERLSKEISGLNSTTE